MSKVLQVVIEIVVVAVMKYELCMIELCHNREIEENLKIVQVCIVFHKSQKIRVRAKVK